MFMSSDSTFGLGANKEDELNWSSLADDTEGTGDMQKTDFRFPLPETYPGKDLLQNDDPTETYDVHAMTCVPTFLKDSSWPADKYQSSLAKRPATTTNSCLDDISLEAASLLQLQLVMEQIEKPLQRHGGRLEHNETYCGSCYGAEMSDECCNSCEEVREAYRKKG